MTAPMPLATVADRAHALARAVGSAVHGKPAVVTEAICCVLAEGHLLVEDVPGVGKTTLARALAAAIGTEATRIQFTPDLLPSDVTGTMVFDQARAAFHFRPGPVFAHVVVADEINRASPKTQSALLEVMAERTVSVDGQPRPVPSPFVVVATQNPVDLEGTYPLPEAQLDRFTMRLSIGYPTPEAEAALLRAELDGPAVEHVRPVTDAAELAAVIAGVKAHVEVAPALERYAVAVGAHTRSAPGVRLGVSPRGVIALVRTARAAAAVAGRSYVTPDDVKAVAVATLAHRVAVRPEAEVAGRTGADVVRDALAAVPVPRTAAP